MKKMILMALACFVAGPVLASPICDELAQAVDEGVRRAAWHHKAANDRLSQFKARYSEIALLGAIPTDHSLKSNSELELAGLNLEKANSELEVAGLNLQLLALNNCLAPSQKPYTIQPE